MQVAPQGPPETGAAEAGRFQGPHHGAVLPGAGPGLRQGARSEGPGFLPTPCRPRSAVQSQRCGAAPSGAGGPHQAQGDAPAGWEFTEADLGVIAQLTLLVNREVKISPPPPGALIQVSTQLLITTWVSSHRS